MPPATTSSAGSCSNATTRPRLAELDQLRRADAGRAAARVRVASRGALARRAWAAPPRRSQGREAACSRARTATTCTKPDNLSDQPHPRPRPLRSPAAPRPTTTPITQTPTALDRAARARKIGEILDELFPSPAIPLAHDDAVPAARRGHPVGAVHRRARQPGHARAVRARPRRTRDGEADAGGRSSGTSRRAGSRRQGPEPRRDERGLLVAEARRRGAERLRRARGAPRRRPQDRERRDGRRRSACRRSRSTPTSIASPAAGSCRARATSRRSSAISRRCFPRTAGTRCTCR